MTPAVADYGSTAVGIPWSLLLALAGGAVLVQCVRVLVTDVVEDVLAAIKRKRSER